MALTKKYTEGLSVIEIYDDNKVSGLKKEEALKEIYDLCNEIAKEQNFIKEQIEEHFYSEEELEILNNES